MHPCQSFPLNQDACCYENKSVASTFREKDDLKDEYTAHSEMGKIIKYGRKSRCKRSTKDMRKGMRKNAKKLKKIAKKFKKIPKKCLTALWRSYIIALASRGIRNAETRYTTEAVKLFAGVVQW